MTKDKFFEELGKMRGQFFINDTGCVRCEDVKDEGGNYACPIEAVRFYLGKADEHQLDNGLAIDNAHYCLDMPLGTARTIVNAADNYTPDPEYFETRRRLLAAVGLEE